MPGSSAPFSPAMSSDEEADALATIAEQDELVEAEQSTIIQEAAWEAEVEHNMQIEADEREADERARQADRASGEKGAEAEDRRRYHNFPKRKSVSLSSPVFSYPPWHPKRRKAIRRLKRKEGVNRVRRNESVLTC